ncbi:MAG: SDR family oxidoreductase [Bradymonadaceae bacterium]
MADSNDEVVAVTGASGGVGRATARAFAERGAKIGLMARGRGGLEQARREVRELGGDAVVLPTDVAEDEQVEEAADQIEEEFGPIDTWVNCAMVTVMSPIHEMEPEEYRRVTEVNYLGYVHGTLAALERMRPRDAGKIVQVSSALAYRSIPLQSAYCASKRAVVGFTESLRTELLHEDSNIGVTMVHMPALNTPQFEWARNKMSYKPRPMGKIYQPGVAADAITWAADHDRREIAVGGSTLQTIAGNKIAPGLLDRYLARTGYSEQLTDEPLEPDRPDNLYEPAPGDYGARGRFDKKAKSRSPQLEVNKHRGLIAAGAAAAAGFALAVMSTDRVGRERSWWGRFLSG